VHGVNTVNDSNYKRPFGGSQRTQCDGRNHTSPTLMKIYIESASIHIHCSIPWNMRNGDDNNLFYPIISSGDLIRLAIRSRSAEGDLTVFGTMAADGRDPASG